MYHYFMTQRSSTTNVKITYNLYNYLNYLDNLVVELGGRGGDRVLAYPF